MLFDLGRLSPVDRDLLRLLEKSSSKALDRIPASGAQAELSWVREVTTAQWQAIVERSVRHGVAPQFYLNLKSAGIQALVPAKVLDHLRQIYWRNLRSVMRMNAALVYCLDALEDRQVPVLVLKGAYLGEQVYGHIGARTMADVDLLVAEKDLARATKCLIKAGVYSTLGSLSGTCRGDLTIDLHWYLCPHLNIAMDQVWARSVPARVAGCEVRGLCPEDLLLHLCLHLSLHHHFLNAGVRTLVDIQAITARFGHKMDWDLLLPRASQWGMPKALVLCLAAACDLLGVQVPDRMLAVEGLGPQAAFAAHWALSNMFDESNARLSAPVLSHHFWNLWRACSIWDRLGQLYKMLLPSSKSIAQKYPVAHHSLKNYAYYAVRLKEQAHPYLSATIRLWRGDRQMRELLQCERRDLAMQDWLAGR